MTIVNEIFTEMKKGILGVQPGLKSSDVMQESLIEAIKGSPSNRHYRNKCEFSIGVLF